MIGHPRRGKTALIETIGNTTKPHESHAHNLYTPPEGSAEDLAARTAGVEVKTIEFPTGERFRISDFAGHLAFLISHHHFLGNEYGFYLALLDAMDALDDMLNEAMFWIRFVLATRPVHYDLPSIFLAFSHCDTSDTGGKDRAQQVLHQLCAHFDGLVQFPQEKRPFLLDCRVWNVEMESLTQQFRVQHSLLRKVKSIRN